METETKTSITLDHTLDEQEQEGINSRDSAEAIASGTENYYKCRKEQPYVNYSGGEGDDFGSASSVSTILLEDSEEIKALKIKIGELEARNKLLDFEIEKINICLVNERNKNAKLEKKLDFVKQNQSIFMKLKEAYINMKYNEAAGRKGVEIKEKGQQTWDGVLCNSCIETEETRRHLETVQNIFKDSYIVKPTQLEQILKTLKYLQDLIDEKERTWSFNAEREFKLKTHIERIENENNTLREVIKSRNSLDEGVSEEVSDLDSNVYKKIIIKYERAIRNFAKKNQEVEIVIPFNDKERRIITHLLSKFMANKRGRSLDNRNANKPANKFPKPHSLERHSSRHSFINASV